MAIVIDATPGGENANSYCTLAEADAYHETRLHVADWTGADTPTKNSALVWAARLLDENLSWDGYPTTPDVQALQWPRIGLYDRKDEEIPDGEIPAGLKSAQAELARLLIAGDRTAEVSSEGMAGLTVGPIDLRFSEKKAAKRKVIPDSVYEMVSLWCERITGQDGMVSLSRA